MDHNLGLINIYLDRYLTFNLNSGILVAPKDPLTSLGWKTYGDCMMTKLNDEMVTCVLDNSYSAEDVFITNICCTRN